VTVEDKQPQQAESVTCEHHFVNEHQPDMPVYWIRRCSLCGTYDAADLREQIDALVTTDRPSLLAWVKARAGLR
jgi:hypothetical protein